MAWGPWQNSVPAPVSYSAYWDEYSVTSSTHRGGFADITYDPTFVADVISDIQSGTPSVSDLQGTGNPNLSAIEPYEWLFTISLEGPFPDDHLEYSGLDMRLVTTFKVDSMPTLNTYPTASDSAVPGDPGTVGDTQYEGGSDTFYWGDFSQHLYHLFGTGSNASRTRGRFAAWVDLTAGPYWPSYTTSDQVFDIDADQVVSIQMSDFPAYRTADSFSIWYENGFQWATSDADFNNTGWAGGGGAGDSGGWQFGGDTTWPVPYVQTTRYRVWLGDLPNIAGDRGPARVNFIPIHRRRP